MLQTKKSVLYHDGSPWVKKGDENFDVTMGSYDGAETCELVGLYLLYQLKGLWIDIGLYRDDGLGVSYLHERIKDQLREKIEAIFKSINLSIIAKDNII